MKKAKDIFKLINDFRKNPKALAKHLEGMRKYLDKNSMVLSEPGKIQVQMVEGEAVFNEAIEYLLSLHYLKPLEWDENLALSAIEHVLDIGPKGLLSYQSSDGTEPEDRITKYGNYVEALGENIDFGPNDAMGVIVSLTLDDGEPERPHRDNLFKSDYQKIGIACGPHKTEYQMCVMDFAFDFVPFNEDSEADTQNHTVNLSTLNNKNNQLGMTNLLNTTNSNLIPSNGYKNDFKDDISIKTTPSQNTVNKNNTNDLDLFVDPKSTANFSNPQNNKLNVNSYNTQDNKLRHKNEETFGSYSNNNIGLANSNNTNSISKLQSPLVRLSLDQPSNEVPHQENNMNTFNPSQNKNIPEQNNPNVQLNLEDEENFEQYSNQIRVSNNKKKVVSKLVEVTTKIIYTFEDGTTREVTEKLSNLFNADN
jgi:uncharacterized protein YkwD